MLSFLVKNDKRILTKKQLPYTYTSETKPGLLKGQRGDHNLLFLDYDGTIQKEIILNKLKDYNYICYNTYSHNIKLNDRFRIILELDNTYTSEDFNKCKTELIELFPYSDQSTFQTNRMIFLPVIYDGIRNPELIYNEGKNFNLQSLLFNVIKKEKDILYSKRNRVFKITKNTKLDKKKQQHTLNKIISNLYNKSQGTTHNELYKSMIALAYAGFNNSEIIYELSPFETTEHKGKVERDVNSLNVSIDPYYYKNLKLKEYINKITTYDKKYENEITVKEYMSEEKTYILNQIQNNKKILIHGDTNIGKTYFFSNVIEKKHKTLILVPLNILGKQIFKQTSQKRHDICFVKEGTYPDYNCNLIISSYEGLHKFQNDEGRDWLKNAIMVVDESHNLTSSSDYNYRQKSMTLINDYKDFADRVVYLSGSPIIDSSIKGFKYIRIKKQKTRTKNIYVQTYKNKIQTLIKNLKNQKGNHLVYNDNKKENEKIYNSLIDLGYNCKLINSDIKQDDLLNTGIIPDNIDVIITTRVLGEGFRVYSDITTLHILKQSSSIVIHQISERTKKTAIKKTILYKPNTSVSKDRETYDNNYLKRMYYDEARTLIQKINDINLKSIQELKNYESKHNKKESILHKNKKTRDKNINKLINNIFINDDKNLIIKNEYTNQYEINELGINYLLHKKNTIYEWNNIDILLYNLQINYNFVFNDKHILTDDNKIDKDLLYLIKKHEKKQKLEEENMFVSVINDLNEIINQENHISKIEIEENTDKYSTFKNKYISRFNEINEVLNNATKTLDLLYKIGTKSTKKHKQIVKILTMKKNGFDNEFINDVKNKLILNKFYTSKELKEIIKPLLKKHSIITSKWRLNNLSSKQTTILIKLIFEVKQKTKRTGKHVDNGYFLLSFYSLKNYVDTTYENVINKNNVLLLNSNNNTVTNNYSFRETISMEEMIELLNKSYLSSS